MSDSGQEVLCGIMNRSEPITNQVVSPISAKITASLWYLEWGTVQGAERKPSEAQVRGMLLSVAVLSLSYLILPTT